MYKYKLMKKRNPKDESAPQKWYATPISESPLSAKETARQATQNTTIGPKELEASIDLLGNYARQQLLAGHTVRVGDLGTLRITFKSEGVEDINLFNASSMIKEPRIVFTPSKEFRESVINNLMFTNCGVLEDDINYASLADYKRDKEQSEEGGGTPGGV